MLLSLRHPMRLIVATCLAWILVGGVPAVARTASRPLHVVVFLVDDMGWMDSSAYGSTYYDSPALERLAREGMRFTRAYAQPLCSPTRASLLTGRSPARHGIIVPNGHLAPAEPQLPDTAPPNQPLRYPTSRSYLDPAEETLAETLRAAGYRTAHIGKWHLGLTEPHWPQRQGFDVAFHAEPSPGPPGNYFSPYGVLPAGAPPDGKRRHRGTITDGPPGEYITDRLTDEAIRFIEESLAADPGRPFFLNLWHFGVHGPWGHKESLTAELADRVDPSGRQDNPVMASMLASVDESLGRLLDTLDRLGIADDTLVVFMSDNGGNVHSLTRDDERSARREAAGDPTLARYRKWAGYKPPTNNAPLRDGKASIYEGGVRVPLIVRLPGRVAPGTTCDTIVGCIDVYPTVLELAGVDRPGGRVIDGVSWVPLLERRGGIDRDAYVVWYPTARGGTAVYQDRWKLIRRYAPATDAPGGHELYDLEADIGETTNLAATEPETVRRLAAHIDRLGAETGALVPQPNPAFRGTAGQPDPFAGLVAQLSRAAPIAGGYRIEGTGPRPYLGTAQVKLHGPIRLDLRVRATSGGSGTVMWKLDSEREFPQDGPRVPFTLEPAADWQDISLDLPVAGTTGIIRLYLPATDAPVDIQSIRYTAGDRQKAWDFSGVTP